MTMTGHDPGSLSPDLPNNPVSSYIHNIEKTLFIRHSKPEFIWKLQRRFNFGNEKIYKKSLEAVDHIFFQCIAQKREQMDNMKEKNMDETNNGINGELAKEDDDLGKDLLTLYILQNHGTPDHGFISTSKFLRDTLATLLSAGQESTSAALSWFFWLLSKNPNAETKIKQELQEKFNTNACEEENITNYNDSPKKLEVIKNLVYLHAAICESLRLYPLVPFNHKVSPEPVFLPSGYKVTPSTTIILNCYAMGRMESIWGNDCMEFKPDRWITKHGLIKHEPSYKFFTFSAGPRVCPGKEIALMQMKAVISAIFLHNFHFEVIEGQCIEPRNSVVLTMRHGLKVRVVKE